MTKIIVVADSRQGKLKKTTGELIAEATRLGAEVATVLIGQDVANLNDGLVNFGSKTQYLLDHPNFKYFSSGPYATAISDAAKQFGADQVWFASNESSKVAAPRVAARLNYACSTDILKVSLQDGSIQIRRPSIAGKVHEITQIPMFIYICTLSTISFILILIPHFLMNKSEN